MTRARQSGKARKGDRRRSRDDLADAPASGLSPAYANLGNALMRQGRLEDAETEFRRAVSLKPEMASAHFNLGIIGMRTGRLHEARRSLETALRYNPDLQPAKAALRDLDTAM